MAEPRESEASKLSLSTNTEEIYDHQDMRNYELEPPPPEFMYLDHPSEDNLLVGGIPEGEEELSLSEFELDLEKNLRVSMENEWKTGFNDKLTRLRESLKQEARKKSGKVSSLVRQEEEILDKRRLEEEKQQLERYRSELEREKKDLMKEVERFLSEKKTEEKLMSLMKDTKQARYCNYSKHSQCKCQHHFNNKIIHKLEEHQQKLE